MLILTKTEELAEQCRSWRKAGEKIALVPTMGYYHKGHESLMRFGREKADKLIVSLFVNPAQFGENEDLDAYPRDFERDRAIAEACGADVLFYPDVSEMYREGHRTWVEVPEMARLLCGASRPIHFRGVCTIVLKLFLLTGADMAIFGQKDWQQQAILKRMVRDLNVPVNIVSRPAVREKDGLALSSRNVYLTEAERRQAPHIYKGLLMARDLAASGYRNAEEIINKVKEYWTREMPDGRVDYVSLVHPENLAKLEYLDKEAVLACALYLGKARLIDNIYINIDDGSSRGNNFLKDQ